MVSYQQEARGKHMSSSKQLTLVICCREGMKSYKCYIGIMIILLQATFRIPISFNPDSMECHRGFGSCSCGGNVGVLGCPRKLGKG